MNYEATPVARIRQMIAAGELAELHAELLTGDAESYPTLLDELADGADEATCLKALEHDLSL